MKKKENFKNLMVFNQDLAGCISCEREFFLANTEGKIVPQAHAALEYINDNVFFSYELSACQIEYKTGPTKNITDLMQRIYELEEQCKQFEKDLGLQRLLLEVGPSDMPLDVYPDERYQFFAQTKTDDQLLSMMRVTACQFHIGMPDYETALKVYNSVIKDIPYLITLGDYSHGQRIALYKQATPFWYPPSLNNFEDHYLQATLAGYCADINNCHTLVRITRYGTIEFRMFGAAPTHEIEKLARTCLSYINI